MARHCVAATKIQTQNNGKTEHHNNLKQDTVMGCVLRLLCPQNADLIKLLLQDCAMKQYTEKDLMQLELSRNMDSTSILDCYGFSVAEIKERCRVVWDHPVVMTGTTQITSRFAMSFRYGAHKDPDRFLYWTFILILRDGIENPYPFTLYKMILSQRLCRHYETQSVLNSW